MTDREKFLEAAKTYIGKNGKFVCLEKLKIGFICDWCAFSVSAIMNDCGFIGKYIKAIEGGAGTIPRYSDGKFGTWFKKGTKTPQAGDLFFLRYNDYPYQDKYFCDHIGIVEAVNGNIITTLEGNVDGISGNWAATSTFKRKVRYLNNATVYAFYRPNWKEEEKKKSLNEIANEVIAGKWGAGEERKKRLTAAGYDFSAVQDQVNNLLKTNNQIKKGSIVKIKNNSKTYDGKKLADFVFSWRFVVMELVGNRAVIGIDGKVTAAVKVSDLILVK